LLPLFSAANAEITICIFKEFTQRALLCFFRYNPNLKDNLYEKRATSITEQLLGSDMVVDYDQLLAKPPNKPDAEFKW
jgi:hypothetical protein